VSSANQRLRLGRLFAVYCAVLRGTDIAFLISDSIGQYNDHIKN
jgi:hypothetical protein